MKYKNLKELNSSKAIVEVQAEDLQPGNIWRMYRDGAKAIHLIDDGRVERLWKGFTDPEISDLNKPFWENSLMDFSRNHVKSQMNVGDMIRFLPNNWGHFARKVVLFKDSVNGQIKTIPEGFWSGEDKLLFPDEVLQIAWNLASDIFKSSLPEDFKYPNYAVSVELLKYSDSLSELNNLFDLLTDSDGEFWTLLGKKFDIHRGKIMAASPFDKRIISSMYRYGSMIPGLNYFLDLMNRNLFYRYSGREDAEVIGPPHIDGIRAQTLLAGDRDSIITEIYDEDCWHEIPLTPTSLHIFPGNFLSKEIGIKPTFHRYSMKKNVIPKDSKPKPNITLLLGLVDPELFKPFAKHFQ